MRAVAQGDFERALAPSGPEGDRGARAGTSTRCGRGSSPRSRALRDAERALIEQARELQRSNEELEQFAYVASHDLQEPLRKVASFTQMLQRRYGGELDERADRYIEFAVDGARRMQELINDLLEFSRVGRMTRPHELHPRAGARRRRDGAARGARSRTRAPRSSCTASCPRSSGDRGLLTVVFQNLIGNGIKFRGEAPPRIDDRRGARRPAPGASTVTDNGIGVDDEYAERIFVIFQRLHTRDAYEGTGIGLAMCRKIIEYHGGRIALAPAEPGRGARFVFTLPGRRPRAKETNRMSIPEHVEIIDVLLVEDDPGDVLLIREAFEDNKVRNRLHVVSDGVEAIEFLRKAGPARRRADARPRPARPQPAPQGRPRGAGRDQGRRRAAQIPVVVLTTSKAEEDVLRSYKLHANAYVTKPVDFDRFIEVVRQIDEFFVTVVKLPIALALSNLTGHMTDQPRDPATEVHRVASPDSTRVASYLAGRDEVSRVLLLYSGGLDTSVMLKWIQDEYEAEVVALTVNLGQPGEDYEVVKDKALRLGALDCHVVDAREEFAREYVLPAIKANADYGDGYPLFTALGRPLIAKLAVEYARKSGCDTIAHGCTGKGNDQVRIEGTVATLAPELKVIAPVRSWAMGRDEEIAYARKHGIPVKGGTESAPYSIDDNLWGRSSEGKWIEDLSHAPDDDVFQLVTRPEVAPDQAEVVTVEFEAGVPVALNGERLGARRADRAGPPSSACATASASSTTSRTGSSASRCATSTRCRPRRSCSRRTRSSSGSAARSTRTSSSRASTSSGPTSSTRASGGSRCGRTSRPTSSTSTGGSPARSGSSCSRAARAWSRARAPNAVYDAQLATFAESGGLFSQQASPGFIEIWSLQSRMARRVRGEE